MLRTRSHGAGVTEFVLDWPEKGNAFGPDEAACLQAAFLSLSPERDAVVMLSAEGPTFCAGGNLPQIVAMAKEGENAVRNTIYKRFQGMFQTIRACELPVLAAVDGPAIGFGADLALVADSLYLGAKGWLRQGWMAVGLIPATGGLLDFRSRASAALYWDYAVAGKVDGPRAERMGLGISVENARDAALATAERLAKQPREALLATKRLLRIEVPQAHLAAALDTQIGFLTSDAFARRAAVIMSKDR